MKNSLQQENHKVNSNHVRCLPVCGSSFPVGGQAENPGGAARSVSEAPARVYSLSMCHTVGCNEVKGLQRQVRVWKGISEFSASKRFGQQVAGGRAKRGKIVKRSVKSRVRQLKHFAKLPSLPEMFSTLTVADDVMAGLDQAGKVAKMNRCKRELSLWLRDSCGVRYWEMTWSQEWKDRKSGDLKGELIPHLHVLWQVTGKDEAEYFELSRKLSQEWVRITRTEKTDQAMRILMKPESHQYLGGSIKKTMGYCAKYTVKQGSDAGEPGESIGRTWGSWGPIEETAPDVIGISESELSSIKRGLRRKFKKAKGFYRASLKVRGMGTMAFIIGSELIRWIDTIRLIQADRVF